MGPKPVWAFWKVPLDKSHSSTWIRTPGHPVHSLDIILITQSLLLSLTPVSKLVKICQSVLQFKDVDSRIDGER